MNKKLTILVFVSFTLGVLSVYSINWVAASSEQENIAGDSIEGLNSRVDKLEEQIVDLQSQIKKLASKPYPNFLTLPGKQPFSGNNVPPGAKQYEINGITYWIIPIKQENK